MAIFSVPHVRIAGLAACVPKRIEDNMTLALMSESERNIFVSTAGVRYRRVAEKGTTASDLCVAAANKLLEQLNWNRSEIQLLVFITQTPDYTIPNTSSILQQKLGLDKSCVAFDVNLGCSGYVYGLSIVAGLLQNMPGAKALLLVGDISTATISMQDKSTAPLFSDAGAATALTWNKDGLIDFNLQTDGKEFDDIIVPDGGLRNRFSEQSLHYHTYDKGISRNNLQMKLDGIKIFNFALREIAPNIQALLQYKNLALADMDYIVFHQANLLMLESVRKKLKVEPQKVPYCLYDYGNTSSATIPLTMLVNLGEKLKHEKLRLLLSGFGVGLSWGSAYLETDKIVCPDLIEI
jgi:3-oxoacyl-[acyl-carrier-protein] synthase III